MITKVDVRAAQGGFLSLPIADSSSGYVVQNIEGLDPVKATLVSSSFAQQDGSQYQSSRRESRNIKITLGLDPDWTIDTVRALRTRLYSVFMPKSAVELTFLMADNLEVKISGRVESFESLMFTQDPVVDVSIMCFDPDFIEPDFIIQNGTSTAGPSSMSFNYVGTVETGIIFKIKPNRDVNEFTIYHQESDGNLKSFDFQASLDDGDVVTISTIPGNKYATLTRGGSDASILYGVSPQANWIELTPGTNSIRVYSEGEPVPYTIQYSNRYGGL